MSTLPVISEFDYNLLPAQVIVPSSQEFAPASPSTVNPKLAVVISPKENHVINYLY
jgi:hypothetical protein